MAEKIENFDKPKRKKSSIVALIFFIIALITSGFLIYNIFQLNGIEDKIRYIIIGTLLLIDLILLIKMRLVWRLKPPKKKKRKKESKRIGFIIFLILYSIICSAVGYIIYYFYGTVNSINKKYVTYSSSLVVLKDNAANKISDIKNYKIGILNDKTSPEGYIIPQKIIKEKKLQDENDVINYDNYIEMITDLYSKEVDAIFLATDYPTIYSSMAGYEEIQNETKIIISQEKEMLKSETSKTENASIGKSVNEPFTILLMGIDSTDEVLTKNAIANGDSLILITFNPKTLNVTMLSIPRDTYVPIACWPGKPENKITHAAAYGNDCMINTIENYFDVNIDYYAKINFKGLVKLVDALGGIDVDVPQDLCTDNSSREVQICINKGPQHLNGEEALVLSRNRKQLINGDFGRGQNQQLVIQAMLQKVKSIKSINQFTNLFNTVSNSIDTNLTTKQILSFYSVVKDIMKLGLSSDSSNIVNIQRLYLYGQSAMIYDSSMRMDLYNYVPNTHSRDDITKEMKMNLGLLNHKTIKKFSFSINNPYEKKVIGEGPYRSTYDSSKYKKASDYEEEKCGTNEELGADGVTCVCKWGYSKKAGVCTKDAEEDTSNNIIDNEDEDNNDSQAKEVTCDGENEELGADGVTCVCKQGYIKQEGVCTKKEEESPTDPMPTE